MTDTLEGKTLPKLTLSCTFPKAGGGYNRKTLEIPSGLGGKWVLLYFYPKDDTPGCTRQACAYRDGQAELKKMGVDVYGVSADDEASHEKFQEKFSLNFPLIADTEKELREKLEVNSRDTFLIDPTGKIRRVWRKVKPDATFAETRDAAKSLMQ